MRNRNDIGNPSISNVLAGIVGYGESRCIPRPGNPASGNIVRFAGPPTTVGRRGRKIWGIPFSLLKLLLRFLFSDVWYRSSYLIWRQWRFRPVASAQSEILERSLTCTEMYLVYPECRQSCSGRENKLFRKPPSSRFGDVLPPRPFVAKKSAAIRRLALNLRCFLICESFCLRMREEKCMATIVST